jgi:hypothetical protein
MPVILATQEAEIRRIGSKPAWANSLQDPILKKPITKKWGAGGVAQGTGPEFNPQYCKKKNWRQPKRLSKKNECINCDIITGQNIMQ